MAWKSIITAVEQNVEKVTITYDILDDAGAVSVQKKSCSTYTGVTD